jgi:Fe-S-cluster containining protein
MSFRPALRRGLQISPRADGGGELSEPNLGWTISLDAQQMKIVRMLDGKRDLDTLARESGAEPEWVERVLRTLQLLSMIEGAGDAIVARIADLVAGRARLSTVVLEETRFACQGSGDCCRGYRLGPLRQEDVARLESLDLASAFPQITDGGFTETLPISDGMQRVYLRRVDEHCIFQQPDGRCGVHARFGSEMKPAMCRMYPLEQLPTIAGRKIYDRGSCSTFATSARTGTRIADEIPRLEKLFGSSLDLFHPVVMLAASAACDYGHLLALQDALCRILPQRRGQADRFATVAWRARELAAALTDCPLAHGEPDATVARLCAVERDATPAPPTTDAALRAGLDAAMDLIDRLSSIGVIAFAAPPRDERGYLSNARRGSELAHSLHLVRSMAAHRIAPSEVASPSLATVAIDDPEHDELFLLSLRQQIFGDNLIADERLGPGVLRLGMAWLVARWTARLHAASDGATRVMPGHFSIGHTLANRVLLSQSLCGVFTDAADEAWSIVAAIPSLA